MPRCPFVSRMQGKTFNIQWILLLSEKNDKFVVIYLDEITMFSKYVEEHYQHLKKVFLKCRKFGLSLNPKKSLFAMKECKLLGQKFSAEAIKIDPSRVEAIKTLSLPSSPREIESFLGKINFLRIFISNFAELVKLITSMLRKGNGVK
jgi:hypothetical protein